MATYPAAALANGFLARALRDNKGISPMKMQKLLYIAHGYGLVECEEPIINEVFEAWKFGPVLNSIYHECKKYGWDDIRHFIKDYDYQTDERTTVPPPDDEKVNEIIDFVWENYGNQSAQALSDWTHQRGGPWDKVTNGGTRILRNQDINNELIRTYFNEHLYTEETAEAASS